MKMRDSDIMSSGVDTLLDTVEMRLQHNVFGCGHTVYCVGHNENERLQHSVFGCGHSVCCVGHDDTETLRQLWW